MAVEIFVPGIYKILEEKKVSLKYFILRPGKESILSVVRYVSRSYQATEKLKVIFLKLKIMDAMLTEFYM